MKANTWLSGAWRQSTAGKGGGSPGPEVGENHAVAFGAGVVGLAEMANAVVFGKFSGLIETGTICREKPAMERAA